jgi:hypothetical protein
LNSPKYLAFVNLQGASIKILAAGSDTPTGKVRGRVPTQKAVEAIDTTILMGLTIERSRILIATEGSVFSKS